MREYNFLVMISPTQPPASGTIYQIATPYAYPSAPTAGETNIPSAFRASCLVRNCVYISDKRRALEVTSHVWRSGQNLE